MGLCPGAGRYRLGYPSCEDRRQERRFGQCLAAAPAGERALRRPSCGAGVRQANLTLPPPLPRHNRSLGPPAPAAGGTACLPLALPQAQARATTTTKSATMANGANFANVLRNRYSSGAPQCGGGLIHVKDAAGGGCQAGALGGDQHAPYFAGFAQRLSR
jgi:hypothetical protein